MLAYVSLAGQKNRTHMTAVEAKHEPLFGIIPAFTFGTILLAGVLLAVPLGVMHVNGGASLAAVVSQHTPAALLPWLDTLLWGIAIIAYFTISWFVSGKKLLVGIGGLVFGIILLLVTDIIIASLISARSGQPTSTIIMAMGQSSWLLGALGVITSFMLLAFPCRGLLVNGFGLLPTDRSVAATAPERNFSFTARANTGPLPTTIPHPRAQDAQPQLAPPESFVLVTPLEGVYGLVTIPVELICASVPEAAGVLIADVPVRIRLSYIVPQLRRATIWLTWQQIFPTGGDDPNRRQGPGRSDTRFQGRWVRIPAKSYVPQVPREYFTVPKVAPLSWMKQPAVPQELQFLQEELVGDGVH